MKKIIISLLVALLIAPVVGVFESEKVKAEGYGYSCSLSEYEVDYINDDGSFSPKGCYSDLDSAKASMHSLGEDFVVRHNSSLSPTKIVAMNSGVAYSYPGRSGTNTMNIYQDASNRSIYYKQTYISNHYEMAYVDTVKYLPEYNGGIIQVAINGFEGYADIEYTDLVPNKYLERGIGLYLGGNNNYDYEEAFYVIPTRNYFSAEKNGNYYDLAFHYSRAYPEEGSKPKTYTIYIGKAPDFMKVGSKYYSCDGVNFFNDTKYTSYAGTYYNYYQFLPLRSKTNISANVLEAFLKNANSSSNMIGHCKDFIDEQNTYGINGLILFAMACHESAYGTSGYAKQRNNLFGWNAFDSNPNNASYFSSVTECINEQAGINLRGYIDITDGRFFSSSLGNKGSGINVKYASDPYWGMSIASIAYACDKYSKNKNGTFTDLDLYPMSLINTFDIEVKQSAADSSNTLYTTQYGPYYQKDFIVITLNKTNKYTAIQSTNAIDDNGNIKTHRTPITTGELNPISTYDFEKSIAYIKNDYLTSLNNVSISTNTDGDVEKPSIEDPSKYVINSGIRSLSISNGKLNVKGYAFIKGKDHSDVSKIAHTVYLMNIENDSLAKTYKAKTEEYKGIKYNDGNSYTNIGYQVDIPLSDIAQGSYYLAVSISNSGTTIGGVVATSNDDYNNISTNINGVNYHLSTNEVYAYRVELDVASLPNVIDYKLINKPSTRPSLFSLNSIEVDKEANLKINGKSFIYYEDFAKQNSIKYTLYIVADASNYLEASSDSIKSSVDYSKILKADYNLDFICFDMNKSLQGLEKGCYLLILKIENGNSLDFVEVRSINDLESNQVKVSNNTYRIFRSDIRDRVMLEVK